MPLDCEVLNDLMGRDVAGRSEGLSTSGDFPSRKNSEQMVPYSLLNRSHVRGLSWAL